MNFRLPVRWLLTFTWVCLVGCGGPSDEVEIPWASSQPLSGVAASESLDCHAIGFYSAFVGGDMPGGPASPSEALAAYFTREGITIAPASVTAYTANAAQLVYEDAGRRVFSAYVEKIGDSWIVTEYASCSEWMGTLPRSGREQG